MRFLGLTKYGLREVVVATVLGGALVAASAYLAAAVSGWFWAPAGVVAMVWLWVIAFFRDPRREVPQRPGIFVSPADGRVADITRIDSDSPLGRDGVRIGIFMSIFNVHVNRSPADGVVESVEHRDGVFLDARDPAASERNESTTIQMRVTEGEDEFPVVVRQIAGLIARRIVTDLREGRNLRRGQRIGMVKFGSRLELLAPAELTGRVCVEIGEKVRAGETVLIEPPKDEADGFTD